MAKKPISKPASGLEKIPPILKTPFWTDRLFWIGLAMVLAWAALIYWLIA